MRVSLRSPKGLQRGGGTLTRATTFSWRTRAWCTASMSSSPASCGSWTAYRPDGSRGQCHGHPEALPAPRPEAPNLQPHRSSARIDAVGERVRPRRITEDLRRQSRRLAAEKRLIERPLRRRVRRECAPATAAVQGRADRIGSVPHKRLRRRAVRGGVTPSKSELSLRRCHPISESARKTAGSLRPTGSSPGRLCRHYTLYMAVYVDIIVRIQGIVIHYSLFPLRDGLSFLRS